MTQVGAGPGRGQPAPPPGQALGVAGAFGAMVAWGASGVLAKLIDMDGLAVVVYRFWLSTLVFVGYLVCFGARRSGRPITWAKFRVAIPGGLGLSLDVAFFFSAVKLTTVANATVIGSLQPLLMLYLGHRFLGERAGRRQLLWSMVALVGVGILLFGTSGLPQTSPRGDALAVCALLAWTAYLYSSKATQGVLSPLEYTAAASLIVAVVNTPLALAFGQDLSWPRWRDWILLGVMSIGSGLFAHLLMNWALTVIPVSVGSMISLLIPAGASVMAWWLLDEPLTVLQAAGIGLTLAALGAITLANVRPRPIDAPPPTAPRGVTP